MGRRTTVDYRSNAEYRASYLKKYRQDNLESLCLKARDYILQKKYGISLTEYNRMLAEQHGVCAICGKPPKKYRLSLDHNHVTGEIRKLLCNVCNKGLYFLENQGWFTKAMLYLKGEK